MTAFLSIAVVVISLAIVGWPLLVNSSRNERMEPEEDSELDNLLLQKDTVFAALSELDFDYAMGNLSAADHGELRQKYAQKAMSVMKEIDVLHLEEDEEIEREIMQLRRGTPGRAGETAPACTGCGAEIDPEDSFCSECGAARGPVCPDCGAGVDLEKRFCSKCGAQLHGAAHD